MASAKLVHHTVNANGGHDGTIELTTTQGTWTLRFSSKEENLIQAKADFQQQLYEFGAEIAKEFGSSALVI